MMRTLVTFILRLWVDSQAEEPAWEGQVENVTSGERVHVRGVEDLARFINAQTSERRSQHPDPQKEASGQTQQK
jgi:hypothetical protein